MEDKANQTTEILRYLEEKGSITSYEAFNLFGCTRLSAKIFNLKKRGYKISSVDEVTKNRYGNTCTFSRYIYKGREDAV